ncbi:MAG: hypothetical protein KAS23_12565, partial [Anaerohalosphaera sp.]|nr:hypothetical protein [Anaerohalosphaera sp.]
MDDYSGSFFIGIACLNKTFMIIEGVMDDKRLFGAKVLSNVALGSLYYRTTFVLDQAGSAAFKNAVP